MIFTYKQVREDLGDFSDITIERFNRARVQVFVYGKWWRASGYSTTLLLDGEIDGYLWANHQGWNV